MAPPPPAPSLMTAWQASGGGALPSQGERCNASQVCVLATGCAVHRPARLARVALRGLAARCGPSRPTTSYISQALTAPQALTATLHAAPSPRTCTQVAGLLRALQAHGPQAAVGPPSPPKHRQHSPDCNTGEEVWRGEGGRRRGAGGSQGGNPCVCSSTWGVSWGAGGSAGGDCLPPQAGKDT